MAEGLEIRTTHTGSLPRPSDLTEMLTRRDHGETVEGLSERITEAVHELVDRQIAAGLDIVNDGEASKISYATYVAERLDGFGEAAPEPMELPGEIDRFPEFYADRLGATVARPACVGPVSHRGLDEVAVDIANLRAALTDRDQTSGAFMSAASPGIIARYLPNRYYATHEEYIWALAEAMKPEYEAIAAAGLIVQLDCPDLPSTHSPAELELHIEAINHATRQIEPERMRMHLCWGNFEAPHTHDVPLAEIITPVLRARPSGLSFEGANPRHAHEWRVFQDVALPDGKTLIPGVIDSTTNYVEHPRLVADRIQRYAAIVGSERVIAGSDCGFATTANHVFVHPTVTWAKLRALVDGAKLASLPSVATAR
jgi:5-methyltetrahydropteroyltriglutamate--homocysteine methyltransferase